MKKRFLIVLIVLMSIALTGIVIVQLLWINNAVNVKEKLFDRAVNEAMNSVVEKIEIKESANIICKTIFFDTLINNKPKVLKTSIRKIYGDEDSTGNIIIANDSLCLSIYQTPDTKFHNKANIDDIVYNTEIIIDSMESSDFTKEIIMQDDGKSYQVHINDFINKKKGKVNEIVNKIFLEYDVKNIPLRDRIDEKSIDTLIRLELSKKSINIKFAYAIFSNEDDSIYYKSQNFDNEKKEKLYSINLFPNDLVFKNDFLFISFPTKDNYIYKSLTSLLIGSIFFTITILIIFFIAVYTIIRQKRISEVKSDFINNMTHEFKTPIATISLAADTILNPKTLDDKSRIQYFTNIIKEENKRMNNQVEKVLLMAQIDNREFILDIELLDIHNLIKQAVANNELQLQKSHAKVELILKADNYKVMVDRIHFTNVISNLIDNAIKYSDSSPEITIETFNKMSSVFITIEDKGIGMTKEVQNKIFEKFYRQTTGNIHNVKGFGLGLNYVASILEKCNAKISVESVFKQGSKFIINIPLSNES